VIGFIFFILVTPLNDLEFAHSTILYFWPEQTTSLETKSYSNLYKTITTPISCEAAKAQHFLTTLTLLYIKPVGYNTRGRRGKTIPMFYQKYIYNYTGRRWGGQEEKVAICPITSETRPFILHSISCNPLIIIIIIIIIKRIGFIYIDHFYITERREKKK
jgi:hypothetical protein